MDTDKYEVSDNTSAYYPDSDPQQDVKFKK